MKNKYLFLTIFSMSLGGYSFSQDQLARDYAPIRAELQSWDPVRGEWLAESMLAISRNQPIPDRTFPEDFTPSEMLRMVPSTNRQNISNTVEANRTSQKGTVNGEVWTHMSGFMSTPNCKLASGRSYGDPHLSTFDGKSFSLQTVGEFVLTKSASGNMEVQTRQRADGDDFSLNTAVAMNVAGDRVCIYADIKPDADFSNPLRVDGQSIRMTNSTYYLAHGGNIRLTGDKYVVTWPTGENVTCEISRRSKFDFINITTQIYPCAPGGYEGLLGNANGRADDDINTRNNVYDYASANRFNTVFNGPNATMSNEAEKEYLVYLAKEFGHAWRVTPMTSLFDYGPGQNTEYFTDYTFPRYHRTVRDLSQQQRDRARRDCENQGIRGNDLDGCIFDGAYVNIPPTRQPEHRDPTEGVVLASLDRGKVVRNVNPPLPTGTGPVKPVGSTPVRPESTGTETKTPAESAPPIGISKPVGQGEAIGRKKPETKTPVVAEPAGTSSTSAAPVKENKPAAAAPEVQLTREREQKPAVKQPEPVILSPEREKPAPIKEPVISTPVKETVPVKETIKVPSSTRERSGTIPAPVKATPAVRGGR